MTIARLLSLMETLRDPDKGCAWDIAQTFSSIAAYTIEEAYEVRDAIERDNLDDLCDELGDLLLQVVFHARIAEESGSFDFSDVVRSIIRKLIRRHPHVFDAQGNVLTAELRVTDRAAIHEIWSKVKSEEQAQRRMRVANPDQDLGSHLGGVSLSLPALTRAEKVSRAAAAFGFDWPDIEQVVAKVREEISEVEDGLRIGNQTAIAEEIGDLLFSVANLARHAGIDPEEALRHGTAKFERRFDAMADRLVQDGTSLVTSDLVTMEAAWQTVKRLEKS